jgi:hypothetical protein
VGPTVRIAPIGGRDAGSARSADSLCGAAILFQNNARYNGGSIEPNHRRTFLAEDKLFKAEYLGSGTFVISKPKRKKIKVRQSELKNPRRGSRK